jgi:hypothetical protein
MDFSLCTIDWTAISAITSFLMTIAAFATIYSSVRQGEKDRDLQIKLLRQQQARQQLDNMATNIMTICRNMNPFHILEYSFKLVNNNFTEEDRYILEKLTVDNYYNQTNLAIQTDRLGNYQSAKSLLKRLKQIHQDYGLWSSTVTTLSKMQGSAELSNPLIEKAIHQMTIEMASRCQKIAPHYQQTIATIIGQEDIAIEKAKKILTIFQTEMARHIQQQQMELNRELTEFVKYEQGRIDKLIE